jgi:hypothetical protein
LTINLHNIANFIMYSTITESLIAK